MSKNENEIDADIVSIDGKSVYKIEKSKPTALVIHCGDNRFQTAFRRFVTEELGISSYAPIVIGGGLHAFGMQSFLPKNFKVLWEQIKFFIKEQKLDQIILINHEDCKWYEKMKDYHPTIPLPIKGKLDLQTALKAILNDFAHVKVRTFWAALDGDNITFEEMK